MALRFLVVDDEPDVLRMVQAMLEAFGCEVAAFTDSRRAEEEVRRQKFDGVFVDCQMPFMNGFELARRIRKTKLNSDAPIVMLSGSIGGEQKGDNPTTAVTYFMDKPIDPITLKGVLAAIADHKAQEKFQ